MYYSISLNGAWEMQYLEDRYTDTKNPFKYTHEEDPVGTEPEDISNNVIEAAVPRYWEDMTEDFRLTSFFSKLRVNPEYGLQSYPIVSYAPDMALPNIMGTFLYRRSFDYSFSAGDTAIHFEGVQNTAYVWINNMFIGFHEGYSTPFEIPIPSGVLKNGRNEIVISVSNHRLKGYCDEPISGITSRAANEYTGGITGDVELRVYKSALRDAAVLVSNDCSEIYIDVEMTEDMPFRWEIYDGETLIKEGDGAAAISTQGMQLWSCETPKLYEMRIISGDAVLKRSFGIRRLSTDGVKFKLNGEPYYLRGVCEHCYFPETIHPSHDYEYYKSIIKQFKKLGFNFIRFHTYIPEEEYMRAADEEGILLHVECPNNTTVGEWEQIVSFCRRHTSVVIYCCGNELMVDEPFIEYLKECASAVHKNTDALFSPMSALRGVEYFWVEKEQEKYLKSEPFCHHPKRFAALSEFSDMYSTYTNGNHSYFSLNCDSRKVDEWSSVYNKPRVSHEICIDGTYTDLSIKNRYLGTRVGKTDMFTSIERHLESKGILKNAQLYFKNSSEWQRRVRKYCFEEVRKSDTIAGYDFLGPIDTHWHTFGYDVGMMNEFYELKPGETVRNVLMYNSDTVLLSDFNKKRNYKAGEIFETALSVSHYGKKSLNKARLEIKLFANGEIVERQCAYIEKIENAAVSEIFTFKCRLPQTDKPREMKLAVTLEADGAFAENEWELYVFPEKEYANTNITVLNKAELQDIIELLRDGRDVLLLGEGPFNGIPTSFRIALAGRTTGNLATVIYDHPILKDMPHSGFCGWQFCDMLEGGSAICFEAEGVPFNPIIEVVSTHKYAIRQAALFEMRALGGRLVVCSLNLKDTDPAAIWLKESIIEYMSSDNFNPIDTIDEAALHRLVNSKVVKPVANTNLAFNANDKTAIRKK